MIADNDLLSMQYARILAENAKEAQKKLAAFPQEKLDAIVESIACEMEKHARELAELSCEETEYGRCEDKEKKNLFVCRTVKEALRGMRCVGPLREDASGHVLEVGVPLGVIAAVCPSTSPVSTTIYKALLAVKSGNAIVFTLHPRAVRTMRRTLDLIIEAAVKAGLPEGCISYLSVTARKGTAELMQHPAVSLILLTGVVSLLDAAMASGKPLICGGTGNGPAFIERTADIRQAVADIMLSKTFDFGIAPSAEQCVVVDAPAAEEVRKAFVEQGAYFMKEEEVRLLASRLFHHDGRRRTDMVGIEASVLARKAGFEVPEGTKVLMAERRYVSDTDAYNRELLAPVLPWYVEDDWMQACEKCIELLLFDREGHTLTIHSRDPEVIRQFILKKPVARVLVNTPAALGGIGASTELFPSMTLGSGLAGKGITTDNVSPMNLVYVRRVGWPMRRAGLPEGMGSSCDTEPDMEALRQLLDRVIRECIASSTK
ncbi:aldehyde dehydrogenase family protein [Mailhella sp.]